MLLPTTRLPREGDEIAERKQSFRPQAKSEPIGRDEDDMSERKRIFRTTRLTPEEVKADQAMREHFKDHPSYTSRGQEWHVLH